MYGSKRNGIDGVGGLPDASRRLQRNRRSESFSSRFRLPMNDSLWRTADVRIMDGMTACGAKQPFVGIDN
jgi:hypothetical protein